MEETYEELMEFDKLKSKILKFVMYKKRTECEVRLRFNSYEEKNVSKIIEFLKENGYINDEQYVERFISEVKALKNLSRKEVEYKLQAKGIDISMLDKYDEELQEYEEISAKNLYNKKKNEMEEEKIKEYLLKKGYKYSTISKINEQ